MSGPPSLCQNHLLASLPSAVFEALAPDLAIVEQPRRRLVATAGQALEWAVFPLTAVVALVGRAGSGGHVEIAPVGREGFVGVPLALGVDMPASDAVVQVPGAVATMDAAAFGRHLARSEPLRERVNRYIAAHLAQIGQAVVCNRLHELEARAARWLLATHDRILGDEFPLTHEQLATMLGVSRPKVTLASAALQRAGLIDNPRNRFRIVDRAGLERASCGCHEVIRAEFERLLGPWSGPGSGAPAVVPALTR